MRTLHVNNLTVSLTTVPKGRHPFNGILYSVHSVRGFHGFVLSHLAPNDDDTKDVRTWSWYADWQAIDAGEVKNWTTRGLRDCVWENVR